jgi:hypothetical protein
MCKTSLLQELFIGTATILVELAPANALLQQLTEMVLAHYEWIANGGSSLAFCNYSPPAHSATTRYQRRTVSTLNGTVLLFSILHR